MEYLLAYDLVESLKKYSKFLEEDNIYCKATGRSVLDLAFHYVNIYYEQTFLSEDHSPLVLDRPLNEYELALFRYHPAFVEKYDDIVTFKGMRLTTHD